MQDRTFKVRPFDHGTFWVWDSKYNHEYLVDLNERVAGECDCDDFQHHVIPSLLNDRPLCRTMCQHILAAKRHQQNT